MSDEEKNLLHDFNDDLNSLTTRLADMRCAAALWMAQEDNV